MREIKFRGKRVDNGEWVYGQILTGGRDRAYRYIDINQDELHEVIPETVGQYAGRKDKNGVKIFEGDIVLLKDTYTDVIDSYIGGPKICDNHLCEVIFKDGAFGLLVTESADIFYEGFYGFNNDEIITEELEVVGNRCENPELLKGKV